MSTQSATTRPARQSPPPHTAATLDAGEQPGAGAVRHDVTFSGGVLRVRYDSRAPLKRVCPMALERTTKTDGRHWACPPPDAERVIGWAKGHGKSVDPAVVEYTHGLWSRELSAMALSSAASTPEQEVPITGLTSTLLETQHVVLQAAKTCWTSLPGSKSKHRALIVADEPGFGKTIMALGALRIEGMHAERAVVVCPTSLTENWQGEMVQHFEFATFRPWVARTTTPGPIPEEADTVVIGWDVLQHWVEALVAWRPDAVVADEGHYAKSGKQRTATKTSVAKDDEGKSVRDEHGNLKIERTTQAVSGSARATAVLKVGTTVAKQGGLAMILTGTPIVNRPAELEPLIEFAGILNLFGGATSFKERFCGPEQVSIGAGRSTTQYKGASNLLELHARLAASGHYVRRTKQLLVDQGLLQRKYVDGVYTYDYGAPPNPWIVHPTVAEMADYNAAEEDLGEFFAQRARELAAELGVRVGHPKVARKFVSESQKHLQRIATLRGLAAQVKVKYVIAKVNEVVERGEKVVIAAHHRDIVNLYAEAFSGLKIQGEMTVQAIEKAKAAFNTTPASEHPVLVLSVEAGKTGHTLCKQTLHGAGPACAYMVFAEQVWTPGDEAQAQDRIWRIGQDREVRIINALLRDSIDFDMYRQRQKKRSVVNAAVDAVNPQESRAEREGATGLAWRFAQTRLDL